MPHQHLIHMFLFVLCRESRYFEDIVKFWIFRLRTIYNFFQVCHSCILAWLHTCIFAYLPTCIHPYLQERRDYSIEIFVSLSKRQRKQTWTESQGIFLFSLCVLLEEADPEKWPSGLFLSICYWKFMLYIFP